MFPQTEKTVNKELDDLEVSYHMAASNCRQQRDAMIATWRDNIHNALMESSGVNFKLLHDVMDSMDRFLNTSKRSPLTD